MDFNLMIKTDTQKTKDKQKTSLFQPVFYTGIVLALIIFFLTYNKYNFYIKIENEKEKTEVNAIYSNLQSNP